jgi:putative transposase
MPRRSKPDPTLSTRVLRLRLKDRHATFLREQAYHVNQVFNYANELGFKVWQREHRFIGSDEITRKRCRRSLRNTLSDASSTAK